MGINLLGIFIRAFHLRATRLSQQFQIFTKYHEQKLFKDKSHNSRPRGWGQATRHVSASAPPLRRLVARLVDCSIVSPSLRSLSRVERCRVKRVRARDSCNQSSCPAMVLSRVYFTEHESNRRLFDSTVPLYRRKAVAATSFQ